VQTADPDGTTALRCAPEATDPDGDALSYVVSWTVDGVAYAGERERVANDRVDGEDTVRGRVWACTAFASDGLSVGEATTASLELTGPEPNQYAFVTRVLVPMPSDLAVLPDDTVLVSTLVGDLYRFDPATDALVASIEGVTGPDDLISIALDPDYGDGAHDWLYGWTNHTCELKRWDLSLEPLALANETVIVSIEGCSAVGHCGGDLLFVPGGAAPGEPDEPDEPVIFLGLGPAGGANGQDDSEPGSKVIAVTREGQPAYSTGYADPRIAALGFRNPWRFARCGEAVCIGDPGGTGAEEINVLTSPGQNFGYPRYEGPDDGAEGFEDPVTWWTHEETTFAEADRDGNGTTGFVHVPAVGVRLSSRALGGRLEGWLPYGEFYDGWIRGLRVRDDGSVTDNVALGHLPWMMSMVELGDGTVLAAELGGSIQQMVVRADRPRIGEAGEALSDAGPDGLPYDVRWPLWSDGAGKDRLLDAPEPVDNSTGSWAWPVGTRLWKTFTEDDEPVETRLIEKRDAGWVAGVYRWEGGDAYLTDGFRDDNAEYVIPSDAICRDCHESARGREWPIGLTPVQLGDEGLASLASALLVAPAAAPDPEGDDLARHVRGWLDGNCAYCHRPDAITSSTTVLTLDLRYDAEDMGLDDVAQYWNANPNMDDGDPYLDPEFPARSVLVQVLEQVAMPPLLVHVPATEEIAYVEAWIAAGGG
jgi:glucose/arabinose dehydrogenase